ncbi:hypothetical protein TSAR_001404 [Trichomalopsis sarcophagae]|uniref:Uncharacterized protein n=1 Tax=Trichomalopsis sarcophagae TaxID=543379 RepID=A0A232F9K5_9HYME|nr:hypothetical protein TSAR_001404 [Trichomalopsis sarcophagae]
MDILISSQRYRVSAILGPIQELLHYKKVSP